MKMPLGGFHKMCKMSSVEIDQNAISKISRVVSYGMVLISIKENLKKSFNSFSIIFLFIKKKTFGLMTPQTSKID